MQKPILLSTLLFVGGCAHAQQVATPTFSEAQVADLKQQHEQSLRAHLPFTPENEALQTPADPLARVPELREPRVGPMRDLYSDTWVAVDELGRALPTAQQTRAPQSGKTVGMFYYINMPTDRGPIQDMSKLLAANPGNPDWGKGNRTYWWGEPDVGYRRSNDFWVLRRDLSMLADAGVDTLMFDTTNANTNWETYFNLCRVARWMRSMGQNTPQISFVTNHIMSERITAEYNELYSKNLYPEMWFKWQGKPLIFGKKDALYPDKKPLPQEIQDFFTWRYSWAWKSEPNRWNWIESSPQAGTPNPDGAGFESVPVTTSSHPTNNIGKSFHDGKEPPLNELDLTPDTNKGLYFAEQMKRALELDPQFLWITQWNEYAAVSPVAGANGAGFIGGKRPAGSRYLVDAYNAEFNRDIAPMKGGWGDNYYLQMTAGIRQFKGARPIPVSHGLQTIELNNWKDWDGVAVEFRDSQGDTLHRDWPGHGGTYYKNDSGRNDIITAKVATDAKNIAFWVQSAGVLSPATDANWMQLLINADSDYQTGWKGYDFVVTGYNPQTQTAALKSLQSDGTAAATATRIAFRVQGTQLALTIPRAALGLNNAATTNFDFHWVDNAPVGGDIHTWWLLGDSAPNGRFNYRYQNRAQ